MPKRTFWDRFFQNFSGFNIAEPYTFHFYVSRFYVYSFHLFQHLGMFCKYCYLFRYYINNHCFDRLLSRNNFIWSASCKKQIERCLLSTTNLETNMCSPKNKQRVQFEVLNLHIFLPVMVLLLVADSTPLPVKLPYLPISRKLSTFVIKLQFSFFILPHSVVSNSKE